MTQQEIRRGFRILRWAARIAGALAAAFIAITFIGSGIGAGFGSLLHLTLRESLMMAAFFSVWLGLILGWWHELLGGSLTVGGMIAFYLLDIAFSGTPPRGVVFPLIAAPGLLFLVYGLATRGRLA